MNTDVTCFGSSFTKRVVPGNPEASFLFEKLSAPLEDRDPECDDPMPLIGGPITEEQLAGIRAWIEAGALKN